MNAADKPKWMLNLGVETPEGEIPPTVRAVHRGVSLGEFPARGSVLSELLAPNKT